MMLSSHLSPSRHGVHYFRWPIPPSKEVKRTTVRISLRTRCPDRAGDLARHLASCGRILRENNALAGLRQSEIREKVQAYFKAQASYLFVGLIISPRVAGVAVDVIEAMGRSLLNTNGGHGGGFGCVRSPRLPSAPDTTPPGPRRHGSTRASASYRLLALPSPCHAGSGRGCLR